MTDPILIIATAMLVSMFLTAFTTLIVGSEKIRWLTTSTFLFGSVVLVAAFWIADLPRSFLIQMAVASGILGILCIRLLKPVRRFVERETRESHG